MWILQPRRWIPPIRLSVTSLARAGRFKPTCCFGLNNRGCWWEHTWALTLHYYLISLKSFVAQGNWTFVHVSTGCELCAPPWSRHVCKVFSSVAKMVLPKSQPWAKPFIDLGSVTHSGKDPTAPGPDPG